MKPLKDAVDALPAAIGEPMRSAQEGKAGWLLLWLIGIPIPVLLGLFLLRGCT